MKPTYTPRVRSVIDEAAAVGRTVERPAECVQDLAGAMLRRIDLPNLLEAHPKVLRIGVAAQPEPRFEPATEMPAAAFGEHRVLRAQLVASLIVALVRAVARYAEVSRDDSGDALAVVEHVCGGETRAAR